jgi:26S proteasome regulatory subunit N2
LSALGTGDKEIFNDIDRVLQTDSVVAGAAAGVSMGLVMAGTASEEANRMLSYARVTPHENISRYT